MKLDGLKRRLSLIENQVLRGRIKVTDDDGNVVYLSGKDAIQDFQAMLEAEDAGVIPEDLMYGLALWSKVDGKEHGAIIDFLKLQSESMLEVEAYVCLRASE